MLTASCWQSGLDYSEYSYDLAEVFLKGDYITSIECLTVIEESAPALTREEKDRISEFVKNSHRSGTHEKNTLTDELVFILNR